VPGIRKPRPADKRGLTVRLVLDITKTRDGRYEGRLTVAGTGVQHDFSGILELLAILEEHLGPEEAGPGPGKGPEPKDSS
jgi:hypothetical protein